MPSIYSSVLGACVMPSVVHSTRQYENNRAEVSHQPPNRAAETIPRPQTPATAEVADLARGRAHGDRVRACSSDDRDAALAAELPARFGLGPTADSHTASGPPWSTRRTLRCS